MRTRSNSFGKGKGQVLAAVLMDEHPRPRHPEVRCRESGRGEISRRGASEVSIVGGACARDEGRVNCCAGACAWNGSGV